jgi:hypothetical protein
MNREPFDIQEAWQTVAMLYGYIASLFGGAAAIAERLLLRRKMQRDLLAWLGPAEALARRVLLLKALALPKPNTPPVLLPATGRLAMAFTDRQAWALDENAETWRVRFRVLPGDAFRRKKIEGEEVLSDRRGGGITYNAYPLARRIEALRRLLDNPEPAVKRLARLLATRRADIVAVFGPYRPPGGPAATALSETQNALDLALNTS